MIQSNLCSEILQLFCLQKIRNHFSPCFNPKLELARSTPIILPAENPQLFFSMFHSQARASKIDVKPKWFIIQCNLCQEILQLFCLQKIRNYFSPCFIRKLEPARSTLSLNGLSYNVIFVRKSSNYFACRKSAIFFSPCFIRKLQPARSTLSLNGLSYNVIFASKSSNYSVC